MTALTRRQVVRFGLVLGPAMFCPRLLQEVTAHVAGQAGSPPASPAARIAQLAAQSPVRRQMWLDRGRAPVGYVKGMAVSYARAYCKLKANDSVAAEMAKPVSTDDRADALAWYAPEFSALGMSNSTPRDVLRHAFVLLTGLGMRESSGQYCEGRDMSATNVTADTAETGLFQVSYNSRRASPLLPELVQRYAGSTEFQDIFREGVSCRASSLRNWGTGPGVEFQRLTKACPALAVEYAAVALRNMRRHWGPINRKRAQLIPDCDTLFQAVEALVDREGVVAV